jgi:hypothetical protein
MMVACAAENADDQDFHLVESDQNKWAAWSALKLVGGTASETVKVPVRRLDWCLTEAGFSQLDLLCVDAEGGDLEVLKGLDFTIWHPKVIVVEYIYHPPNTFADYLTPYGYGRVLQSVENEVYRAAEPTVQEPAAS